MKLPIVINDNGDISFFESAVDAKRYLESYDAPSYEAFDANGVLLQLSEKTSAMWSMYR